ncbi:MAG: glycosyltransferase, partial [Fibrobacter sp.]|nr:glycosyltransferase [Fibrobacter sp.]
YNEGRAMAKGDILVFIPEDALFMKMNWGVALEQKFGADPVLGLVGVAGTQFLYQNKYSWTAAGRPFIKGRIVYHLENGDFFAVVFSPENGDFEVVACDGSFMALRGTLFDRISFDETNFDSNYFFDLDLSMQVSLIARQIITTDILVKRRVQNTFDKQWHHYGELFLKKHGHLLPVSCVNAVPDPENFVSSKFVNLKGKAPMETIL